MNFSKIKIFSVMQEQMRYLSERQGILSANIANLDVSGAKAMDIKSPDFARMVGASSGAAGKSGKLGMATTNAQHLSGAGKGKGEYSADAQRHSYEVRPTGNNIVLEEQMMKVAETTAQYQQTTATYRKMSDLMKTALGTKG